MHVSLFTTILFIIAKIWYQSKCPSADKKDVYTHNRILVIKKNEILPFNNMDGLTGYYAKWKMPSTVWFQLRVESKKTTNRNGFINIQNKLAIVSWEEGREMGKWEVKGIKLHTSSYKVSHRAEKYNIGNIRKKNAVCSLGFWIFTVESGSGCGLCTTWVHTCSVKIWKTKNLNFIEKII